MRKIAVTGGLSCGKSSVCRFLKKFGAYVVSADEIVHQLLTPDTQTGKAVIQLIGSDIVINHQISRSKIAEKVFSQQSLLKSLEKILHPAVQNEIVKLYEKVVKENNTTLFVAEIPLLFEAEGLNFDTFYDVIVAVIASPEKALNRFKEKTGYFSDEYDKRTSQQLPLEEKAKRAHFIIENNGSLKDLENKTFDLFEKLTNSKLSIKV